MKKYFQLILVMSIMTNTIAQNVGIGTTTPEAKLHVDAISGNMAIFNSSSATSYVLFSENNFIRGYIGSIFGTTEDFDIGTLGSPVSRMHLTTNAIPRLTVAGNGNVGIGTTSPAYKLDVAGRLRIQHTTNTAGIWLDGSTNAIRSFVGMADDNHVGFYGNGGADWNFTMNVNNGNTGIGTAAPTAKLDVNGALRIRGGSPAPGSVLTSVDANGNAVWKENNVAFKAYGMNSGYNSFPPTTTYHRVHFGGEKFDLGNDYNLLPPGATADANSSIFTAPVAGIYHFDLNIEAETSDETEPVFAGTVKLKLNRNGVVSDLAITNATSNVVGAIENMASMSFSTNELLNANDKVYIEIIVTTLANSSSVSYGPATWFSGHLVKAL